MNKKQLTCLWIGIIVFVLIGLFPPRPRIGRTGIPQDDEVVIIMKHPVEGRIDGARLFSYWAMVAVITVSQVV
jgi:hypothetical protein